MNADLEIASSDEEREDAISGMPSRQVQLRQALLALIALLDPPITP
jgi:hypothetical protein